LKSEPLDNNDEAYLVKCCKDNNPTAQKKLYDKYVEGMMILCLRYIKDSEVAKEVLMDSFFKFFRNIGSFSYLGEGSVRAWLKKITVNQCLMHVRKRPAFVIATEAEQINEVAIDDDVTGNMSAKDILKLVHSLPDGYKVVFNLYVFEGFNHKEIGQLLEISESTSKSQLHRAKAMLKEKILQFK
jgi:RNA polymerase sigma factor (sigma-70 family)